MKNVKNWSGAITNLAANTGEVQNSSLPAFFEFTTFLVIKHQSIWKFLETLPYLVFVI